MTSRWVLKCDACGADAYILNKKPEPHQIIQASCTTYMDGRPVKPHDYIICESCKHIMKPTTAMTREEENG
jgi:hypothetical protein